MHEVNRTNDFSTTLFNYFWDIPFDKADELWENIQLKMKEYINNNQGAASELDKKLARPEWAKVKLFLEAKISYDEFKQLNDCI